MKIIFHKIKFHPLFLLLAISCIATSLFKEFIVVTSLVFVHEIGHVIVADYFHWDIKRITFYPFGGLTTFKTALNTPLKEEFYVSIAGVMMQCLFFLLIMVCYQIGVIRESVYHLFQFYHITLLWFNLLPITSLDGGKILSSLLELFLPYRFVLRFMIVLSYAFLLVVILFLPYNMNLYLMLSILLCKILIESKNISLLFEQFLLERYFHTYQFKKRKIVQNESAMMKDRKHIFKEGNFYYSEKEFLRKKFDIDH